MKKKCFLYFYILLLLFILLKCEEYTSTELENLVKNHIDTTEGYDALIDDDLFTNKISDDEGDKLYSLLGTIKSNKGDSIYLVIVEKYSENLDTMAEKLAGEYCASKNKCVFIVYDDYRKKIGSYIGTQTQFKSTDINTKFDEIYSNNKNKSNYIYSCFNELLNNTTADFTSDDIETLVKKSIDTSEGYDLLIDDNLFTTNKITNDEAEKLFSLLKNIKENKGHKIYLAMVYKYNGNSNLNTLSEKLAEEFCVSKKQCVFILYDDYTKKIGSYFGEQTDLSSSDINNKFDELYSNNKNNNNYIYECFNELLNHIEKNMKKAETNYTAIIIIVVVIVLVGGGYLLYKCWKNKKQKKEENEEKQTETKGNTVKSEQQQMKNQPKMLTQQQMMASQQQMMNQKNMNQQNMNMNQQNMNMNQQNMNMNQQNMNMNQQQMMNMNQQPVSAGFGSNNTNF
jgi:hypothetical protein